MTTMRLMAAMTMAALVGCGGLAIDETEEVGQAAADVLASFDEAGTGSGFAWNVVPLDRPGFDKSPLDRALDLAMPSAYAAACWGQSFATCNAGVRTKDFGDCALGANKLSGTVKLTFSDSGCSMAATGASVTREANFTLTGRRDATLSVTSPGGGQMATRTADGWLFKVKGMERVMKDRNDKTLFDIATHTEEDLVVQGRERFNRTIQSGKMVIEHKLAGYTTTLVPENVKWDGTCNCPVSGKLTGSITGGTSSGDSAVVEFTGCGTGKVTVGAEVKDVTFDRCAAL
ncbi:MAG: hypothetical protein HY901_32115 [Deltaproteobacteria bacterium]|nr:hypothetical protein [Deltaproteobacteria bacterium]